MVINNKETLFLVIYNVGTRALIRQGAAVLENTGKEKKGNEEKEEKRDLGWW